MEVILDFTGTICFLEQQLKFDQSCQNVVYV